MEQTTIRRLRPGTLASWREAAKANGRSLEAELRDLIERNAPRQPRDREALLALSRELQAATKGPPGDSTPFLRAIRDSGPGSDL